MPRIARLVIKEEKAVYHVMSRTALDGYVLGDVEKDFLVNHIRWLAKVYCAEVIGFCIMGNHFHLLVRMEPGVDKPLSEIQKRFEIYYGKDDKRELSKELIPALINCLAYIDLNPIRAGIAKKSEEYRWCSLGYHVQTKNRGRFLSTDFGLREFLYEGEKVRLAHYRRFVYEKGGLMTGVEDQPSTLDLSRVERFRYRTRYFTDSGIIGTKEFVARVYQDFKGYFSSKHEKQPKPVQGLDGIYSLKRLSENIG